MGPGEPPPSVSHEVMGASSSLAPCGGIGGMGIGRGKPSDATMHSVRAARMHHGVGPGPPCTAPYAGRPSLYRSPERHYAPGYENYRTSTTGHFPSGLAAVRARVGVRIRVRVRLGPRLGLR